MTLLSVAKRVFNGSTKANEHSTIRINRTSRLFGNVGIALLIGLKMAYDSGLAQRVREILEEKQGFKEKKMFGGICFLLKGNMACGILDDDLIVRVGPKEYEDSLKLPHVRKFDITGRPMKGWVMVSYDGLDSDTDLFEWVQRGINTALSLPAK